MKPEERRLKQWRNGKRTFTEWLRDPKCTLLINNMDFPEPIIFKKLKSRENL